MTHDSGDLTDFTEEQKDLLRHYFGHTPLDENRVEQTMHAARAHVRALRAARQRKRWSLAVSMSLVASLVAAGFWRWSGEDSDELSFEHAIGISVGNETHMGGNRQAAAGRLWRLVKASLDNLIQRNRLTDEIRLQLIAAATAEEPIPQEYTGEFAPLANKLAAGERLSRQEIRDLTKMLQSAIYAMRVAAHHSDSLRIVSNVHRLRLLKRLGIENPDPDVSWGR